MAEINEPHADCCGDELVGVRNEIECFFGDKKNPRVVGIGQISWAIAYKLFEMRERRKEGYLRKKDQTSAMTFTSPASDCRID
jgi:hypothetical protein